MDHYIYKILYPIDYQTVNQSTPNDDQFLNHRLICSDKKWEASKNNIAYLIIIITNIHGYINVLIFTISAIVILLRIHNIFLTVLTFIWFYLNNEKIFYFPERENWHQKKKCKLQGQLVIGGWGVKLNVFPNYYFISTFHNKIKTF